MKLNKYVMNQNIASHSLEINGFANTISMIELSYIIKINIFKILTNYLSKSIVYYIV